MTWCGGPDVQKDEAGSLHADHGGPAADPAARYIITCVVLLMYTYILPVDLQ